jgi:hypothetical protein
LERDLLEREGLLVCTSGDSEKSSKNHGSLLVGKGHSRDKPAGGFEPPSSMTFGISHRSPAAVVARIASLLAWQYLATHTLRLTTASVNAPSVTDVSFFNHGGNI